MLHENLKIGSARNGLNNGAHNDPTETQRPREEVVKGERDKLSGKHCLVKT